MTPDKPDNVQYSPNQKFERGGPGRSYSGYALEWWQSLILLAGLGILSLLISGVMTLFGSIRLNALVTELGAFLIPVIIVIMTTRVRRSPELGLGSVVTATRVLLLIALGAAWAVSASLLAGVAHEIYPMPRVFADVLVDLLWAESIPEMIAALIVVAVLPGVAEELIFRGVVQPSMIERFGPKAGIALTALFFATYHLNPWTFVPIFFVGLIFGTLVYWSGSVWAGVLAHFGANSLAVFVMNSHDEINYEILTEGESPVIFAVSVPVALAGTYLYYRLTRDQADSDRD